MMKKILVILACFSNAAFAYNENPHQPFDMTHNINDNIKIEFRQAVNVNQACDEESHRRGLGGIPYKVEACSFWNTAGLLTKANSTCLIITEPNTNMHTLGHELRHCLQGEFHAGKK
jgi:hypothetical protein